MDLNEVFEEAYQLHDQVKQSKEYRQLKEAEKQMFQNQELSAIFFRYRQIQENLSSFPSQEEIKHLHELKMSIDEHPLVKNYKEQYQIFKVKIEELKNKNITLSMNDYGNFEKVGSLGLTLPRNDKQITTKPGDIILYQGNQLTIYYDTNTWNFTKIGSIPNMTRESMLDFLGIGPIQVTLSIN